MVAFLFDFCSNYLKSALFGVSGLMYLKNGLGFFVFGLIYPEMDLYFSYLNLYFVEADLYSVSELMLLGKRDLSPKGTQAHARAQLRPRPKSDPGPNRPGPEWDPGLGQAQMGTWPRTFPWCVFPESSPQGNKIFMAMCYSRGSGICIQCQQNRTQKSR